MVQRMAEWLRMELPDAPAVGAPFRLPEDEPLQRLLHSPYVESACLIDSDGQLLYPPSPRALPPPDPLDAAELSPAQQDAWLALERMWSGEQAVARGEL